MLEKGQEINIKLSKSKKKKEGKEDQITISYAQSEQNKYINKRTLIKGLLTIIKENF
jgi:hypothetical protein